MIKMFKKINYRHRINTWNERSTSNDNSNGVMTSIRPIWWTRRGKVNDERVNRSRSLCSSFVGRELRTIVRRSPFADSFVLTRSFANDILLFAKLPPGVYTSGFVVMNCLSVTIQNTQMLPITGNVEIGRHGWKFKYQILSKNTTTVAK